MGRGSSPTYLCQRPLGPGQPEGRVHGAIEFDGSGQLSSGLLRPADLRGQGAKAKVAVGQKRADSPFFG
jgi:hypothetical protein